MTWKQLSEEKEKAADLLRTQTFRRDAISRTYYSIYALAVESVSRFGPFNGGAWRNPPHSDVPGLLDRLPGYSNETKKEMKSIFKELFKKRVDADYRPNVIIDETVLKEVFRKAHQFKELL